MRLCLVYVFVCLFLVASATGTHFRGGTAWWSPSSNYSEDFQEFRLEYKLGWRNSFQDFNCDATPSERSLVVGYGSWDSDDGVIGRADFVCTEHDPQLDWMVGYNQLLYNATNSPSFLDVWYQGRCWIDELYYPGCAWNLSLQANLGVRADTGRPNFSPKSGSIPIMRMQAGCPTTVEIPTTDPDGDTVRCRFATTPDECGDVCQRFPFFSFAEDSCSLKYNGGGSDSLVTVTVVVEDYARLPFLMDEGTDQEILYLTEDKISHVPLQFLVSLYTSDDPCNTRPVFVDPTPPDGQVITVIVGVSISIPIYAIPSTSSENITDFVFIFPHGAEKSSIVKTGVANAYMVNVTWMPTSSQIGTNIFCFTAKDANRISEQRCITMVVGDEPSACEIDNGGCSNTCVTLGTSYYCDCPRDCWSLADDQRTCIPDVSTQCLPSSIEISVSTCAVDNDVLSIGQFEPLDPIPDECQLREENGSYKFSFAFDRCQMRVQEDFWDITYSNYVRLYADLTGPGSGSPITRGSWYTIPVTCKFSKFGNLTMSFRPQNQNVELQSVPGFGSFSFFIDFYQNVTFEEAASPYDYPLSATVNSDIYFAVRAVGGTVGMQLFTVDCVATPTLDTTEDTPSYTMINNGCLEDNTMVEYAATNPMENRYSIKAFKFRENVVADNSSIFIQCSVVVCTVGTTITTCSRGCDNAVFGGRRKRDVVVSARHRWRRQAISDDDDDLVVDADSATDNITESPIHDVTSDGGIQILLVNQGNDGAGSPSISVSSTSGGGGDGGAGAETTTHDLTLLSIQIGIAVGAISLVVLIVVVGAIVYHNKVVRPRHEVAPLHNQHHHHHHGHATPRHHGHATYVEDIYLPPGDFTRPAPPGTFTRPAPPGTASRRRGDDEQRATVNDADDEAGATVEQRYVWARRVVSVPRAPPSDGMRKQGW